MPFGSRCLGELGDLSAGEALRLGLADEVVPASDLIARAMAVAEVVAAQSPSAVEATKRAARAARELPYSEAMQFGWDLVMSTAHPP